MGVLLAGPVTDFSAFMLSVVLVGIELKKQKNEKIEIASLQDVSITYITCIEEISKEKMICRILEGNPAETETRIYIHCLLYTSRCVSETGIVPMKGRKTCL